MVASSIARTDCCYTRTAAFWGKTIALRGFTSTRLVWSTSLGSFNACGQQRASWRSLAKVFASWKCSIVTHQVHLSCMRCRSLLMLSRWLISSDNCYIEQALKCGRLLTKVTRWSCLQSSTRVLRRYSCSWCLFDASRRDTATVDSYFDLTRSTATHCTTIFASSSPSGRRRQS